MTSAYFVRRFGPADAKSIEATFGIEINNFFGHIAEDSSGVPIGLQWLEQTAHDQANIFTHTVAHKYQLKVASALFSSTKSLCETRAISTLIANIDPNNQSAISYYQSRGFEPTFSQGGAVVSLIYGLN